MGFYDCRCMVTGVSLKGSDAALVLLHQPATDRYVPLALAITGCYDRLGSIDGIDEDDNTRLILRFFLNGLQSGSFVADEESLRVSKYFPIRTTEELLHGFERNMNDGPGYAVLNEQPVAFALVACTIWDAITKAAPPPLKPLAVRFQVLFRESPASALIYADSLDEVANKIDELHAVDAFLKTRGLAWRPSPAAGQDYSDEMREYLAEARTVFADSPVVLAALKQYEGDVQHLLQDDD